MVTPDAQRSMSSFLGITTGLSIRELDLDAIKASKMAYIEGYLVPEAGARNAAVEAKKAK